MSDEEKKAIEHIKNYPINWLIENVNESAIKIVLNLIEKQSKEIEHQKEKRENQKKELAILNAKQIEFNKLVNTVNSYKGQFKRQQKEIEELNLENIELKQSKIVDKNSIPNQDNFYDCYNFIHKDKIKARIEELEGFLYKGNIKDDFLMIRIKAKIQELQSLLEKE